MKKLLKIFMFVALFSSCWVVLAQNNSDISIMPEWNNVWDMVKSIWSWGKVWENYRNEASKQHTLWEQLSSWVMTWDTILDYCAYLAKFLGEVALLVWALAIIYLWYQKIVGSIFTEKPKGLTMVVIWILVITFAYVIIKLIWSAFIS